ncbi:calcium release-activated calcium channel protein 1-like [Panonychus citri]|uniref:calcium release-activated calcium channel protein 1-like n=1 Tax=Panonychus citri TaxID=50023 RepID=UPI0023078802|nr:calcium release-activated calcium channel protein 1-like [Panonychus citri]
MINSKEESNITNGNYLSCRRLHLSRAKLKASSRTSALLSGFAMVAMVEVSLNPDSRNPIPVPLLISFVLCTTLLVSVHMLALMISTCILPNIESDCEQLSELRESQPTLKIHSRTLIDSPHDTLSHYIEIAWLFSTVFGVFLFLIEIAFLCWVKFWDIGVNQGGSGKKAAFASTILLIPVFVVFIAFAVHFYRKLVNYKYERSAKNLEELVTMVTNLQEPV